MSARYHLVWYGSEALCGARVVDAEANRAARENCKECADVQSIAYVHLTADQLQWIRRVRAARVAATADG